MLPPGWVYNETVRIIATPGTPPAEDPAELEKHWGRAWGVDNDVGRIRAVLMHRPGKEMEIVDPSKRVEAIGSFGDLDKGWYFQSDSVPPIAATQAQHDALAVAPGELLMPEGATNRTLDGMAKEGLTWTILPFDKMQLNGGGIHCSTTPLIRDQV